MQAARRCLLLWRRLQEHGGVHDSHAERLLALEKAAWTAALISLPAPSATASAASPASTSPAPAANGAAVPAADEASAPAAHSPDEAWIETKDVVLRIDRATLGNRPVRGLLAGQHNVKIHLRPLCRIGHRDR
jgi:hypothetical protein